MDICLQNKWKPLCIFVYCLSIGGHSKITTHQAIPFETCV